MQWAILTTFSTYIVSLIKDDNWGLLQFFGHKVSDFRIQKVMITVHNYVGMVNLTTEAGELALVSQNSEKEFFTISFMSQLDILLPKVQHVGHKTESNDYWWITYMYYLKVSLLKLNLKSNANSESSLILVLRSKFIESWPGWILTAPSPPCPKPFFCLKLLWDKVLKVNLDFQGMIFSKMLKVQKSMCKDLFG